MIYFFLLCDVAEVQEKEIEFQLSTVSLPCRTEGKPDKSFFFILKKTNGYFIVLLRINKRHSFGLHI